jgi:hypothetical protein
MATKVVFITATTGSWTVPADFGSLVSIEAIGGGGNGGGSLFNGGGGGGGGGGAYAAITSLSGLSANGTVYVRATTGDTWFNKTSNAAPTSTSNGVLAKGGTNGSIITAGTGGSSANSVGSTKYAGGNGGAGTGSPSHTSGGGGGAAGPSGAGSNADNTSDFQGGDADNGSLTQSSTTQGGAGQAGSIYTQTSDSATAGPGTGGNGRFDTTVNGGAGGLYGGGGGGSRQSASGTGGGAGGGGLIVFTYDDGVSSSFAVTESPDTSSISISAVHTASLAATEAADTASLAVSIVPVATSDLAATETADIASIDVSARHTTSLSVTETADTASIDLTAARTADLAVAEAGDVALVLLFDGVVVSLAAAEGPDTADFQAVAVAPITVALAATEESDRAAFSDYEPVVVAPSYSYWLKTKARTRRRTSPPAPRGKVIDEAVLRQMEKERLAALVLKAKQEALGRMTEARVRAGLPFKDTQVERSRIEAAKRKRRMSFGDLVERMRLGDRMTIE